ncbi:hypothetical protein [Uliginosibacterium sp. H1]|uniref:hypothetical protein n=1 Tax=Uliginosibacterium sp. H1 TaxID=3114757 RepID=UPI002E17BF1A|nr:hypothetical protein [Uliginosibacterium sp. H1]
MKKLAAGRPGIAALALCLIVMSPSALAQPVADPVLVEVGFMTVEEFQSLDAPAQARYAAGVVDGWFSSALYGSSTSRLARIKGCMTGLDPVQVADIWRAFITRHPERAQHQMSVVAYAATREICER